MSVTQKVLLVVGLLLLAGAWAGPLPDLARQAFAAHMALHLIVVAVAAPLLAIAIAGTAVDPVRKYARVFNPIAASLVELVVVWTWHAPAWHVAAREQGSAFMIEQASFLTAGLALWLAVLGGDHRHRHERDGAAVFALLLTSMHMTLLGALFVFANRPLFAHHEERAIAAVALADQHLGGALMLLVGGASYLAGGLGVMAGVLGRHTTFARPTRSTVAPPRTRQELSG